MRGSKCERGAGWCFGWAGIHSALFVLLFTFEWMWAASFAYVIPLVVLGVGARRTGWAVTAAWVWQSAAWVWVNRWMSEVTAAGWPVLGMYLAAWQGIFVWVVRCSARGWWGRGWRMGVVVPVAWTGLEFLRGEVVLQGYPWFLSAQPLTSVPVLVQSADLLGQYWVVFLTQLPAGLAGWWMVSGLQGRSPEEREKGWRMKKGRGVTAGCVAVAGVYAGMLGYGAWRLGEVEPLSTGIRVLAIQTNLPQSNKIRWTVEEQERDLEGFIELTERAFAESGGDAEVVIWPETMAPGLGFEATTLEYLEWLNSDTKKMRGWARRVEGEAKKLGVPMLVGSSTWEGAWLREDGILDSKKRYNSAVVVWGEGPYSRYDKVVLTPFGETMPYISKWKWLEERLLALGAGGMKFDLDSAEGAKRVEIPVKGGVVEAGTPICFEDTVGYLCRRLVWTGGEKRAKVLINLSNDGWFGRQDRERRRHVEIAKLRCVENRVPMVRCVNTGETVVVDSCGRETAHSKGGPRAAGWLEAEVIYDARESVYGRVGDAWGYVCAGGMMAAWCMRFVRRTKKKE